MRIKYVLLTVVALIVLVLAGGYIYLSTLDLEALKARLETEVEKATGRQLSIEGPVDLQIGLQPAVAVEQVTLSNADWGSRPDMVTLERFELAVDLLPLLTGQVQVNRVILVRPDILLETSPAGRGNWVMTDAADAAPDAPAEPTEPGAAGSDAPLIPEVATVEIEEGQFVYRDGVTGQTTAIGIDSLVLGRSATAQELDLAAIFQGAEIALAGTIGPPGSVLADEDLPLDLSGSVAGNELSVAGTVATPLSAPTPNLSFSVAGESLASFAPLAGGAEIPPLGPYSLEGRVVAEGQSYGIEGLAVTLGGSDLAGNVTADISGARPQVSGEFTAAVVDLADFQADGSQADGGEAGGGQAGGEAAPAEESPYVIPETPLPLEGLRAADVALQLQAGVLRVAPGLEMTDMTVGVTLAGGNLQVAPLQAAYQDSRLEGQVSLDASSDVPRLVTQVSVDQLDFGRMLSERGVSEDVQGTMDIRVDLTGSGASPRAIASSLNGTTELVNDGGQISNRLLAILGAGFTDVLGPLFGGQDTTALNCIVSRFQVTDGVATSQALVLDTATFSLAGAGDVDLRSEGLDLTFDTASRVPSLVSLAIPFKVQGTLKNPSVVPDPVAALQGVAGAAATIVNPLAVLGTVAGGTVLGGVTGGDDSSANPCLAALDPEAQAAAGAEPQDSGPVEGVGEAVRDGAEGAGQAIEEGVERLRGLFGD